MISGKSGILIITLVIKPPMDALNKRFIFCRKISASDEKKSLPAQEITNARIETLEGLRGLAAITVLLWHSMLGFAPQASGIFEGFSRNQAISGKPWTFFVNGSGSVVFFFVLSGFVLSRSALQSGSQKTISNGALKRWPRLLLPTVVATLVSWLLFYFDLYHYKQAANITHSPWLEQFAYAGIQPIGYPIWKALEQGLFFTFFRGDSYYDSSIWTMHFEFVASFVIFGLALLVLTYKDRGYWKAAFPVAIVIVLANFVSKWYPPFFLGLALALVLPKTLKINTSVRLIAFIFGLYLLGCWQTVGAYSWLSWVPFQYVDAIGSALIISVCYDIRLNGALSKMARFLGDLSFPFYLLHVLVLCSFGSALFVRLKSTHINHTTLITTISTLALSVMISLPLIYINKKWVLLLNRLIR